MLAMRPLVVLIVASSAVARFATPAGADGCLMAAPVGPPELVVGATFPVLDTPPLPDLVLDTRERADRHLRTRVHRLLFGNASEPIVPLEDTLLLQEFADWMSDEAYLPNAGGGWGMDAQADVFGGGWGASGQEPVFRREPGPTLGEPWPPAEGQGPYLDALDAVDRAIRGRFDTSRID